jgi:hypothetical protein
VADVCTLGGVTPLDLNTRVKTFVLYGVDLGTSGLILQAQSREEILADKVVALALPENRIKNRDLWDIAWLIQQGVELPLQLIPLKIRDHKGEKAGFIAALEARLPGLRGQPDVRAEFKKFAARLRAPVEAQPEAEDAVSEITAQPSAVWNVRQIVGPHFR